jgi:hypothetical protein
MTSVFREPLINAMRTACDDMLRFSGNPARRLNAEYLFTVAVAKQIDKLNSYYGDPYQIHLEKKTREFARNCMHPVKFGNPMQRSSCKIRKGFPRLARNGRIDIAVYQEIPNNGYLDSQPVCAIELKGFNPARNLVLKDLRRNLEFFSIIGPTGASVLGSALFGALHCWPNIDTECEETQKYERLRARYEGWLSQLPKLSNFHSAVSVHEVRKNLEGEVVEDGGCQVLDMDCRHNFAGIIVEFTATGIKHQDTADGANGFVFLC